MCVLTTCVFCVCSVVRHNFSYANAQAYSSSTCLRVCECVSRESLKIHTILLITIYHTQAAMCRQTRAGRGRGPETRHDRHIYLICCFIVLP